MSKNDLSYNSGQNSRDIPSAMESERLMAEDAPTVVDILTERNAEDLIEALGLSNYVGGNRG